MMKITAQRTVRLARMVLVLGEGREEPKVTSWDGLPRRKRLEFQIEIPVKLIEEMLARKREQPPNAQPMPLPLRKPAPSSPRFVLPLARVVIPL